MPRVPLRRRHQPPRSYRRLALQCPLELIDQYIRTLFAATRIVAAIQKNALLGNDELGALPDCRELYRGQRS